MKLEISTMCIGLSACVLGCASPRMPAAVPHHTSIVASPGSVHVGASRVDITPPPGPSTFGSATDAMPTMGYWTRLYCRPFVFETAAGERTAIVPCDLPAISTLLQRSVAAALSRLDPAHAIPATRLMITATHTHAGPGHYFESLAFGGVLSARRPGFDPTMVAFLAERIADGVKRAAVHAERAGPARLRWLRTPVWQLTRNRSLPAHLANPVRFPLDPALGPAPAGLPIVQQEIDPALDVLQIETKQGASIGALAFFAMHPTVLSPADRVFGGDVFGVAARAVEREIRRKGASTRAPDDPDPVVAIVNTNEGDIAPSWLEETHREAIRIGDLLADNIWTSLEDESKPWSTTTLVDSRYIEVPLPSATFFRTNKEMTAFEQNAERLCCKAVFGQAAAHGSTDHPASTDRLMDVVPDSTVNPKGSIEECHFPKIALLGPLQPVLVGPSGFPAQVPLSLLRLDDRFIAFVPAEMTLTAGMTLRRWIDAYAPASTSGPPRSIIAGLANGYIQYVATPAEYELQHYEGASTLYGPNTLALLVDRFARLAQAMTGYDEPALGQAAAFSYETAPERHRLPDIDHVAEPFQRRKHVAACRLGVVGAEDESICSYWDDAGPGEIGVGVDAAPWVKLVDDATREPVKLCGASRIGQTGCDPAGFIDDRGIEFVTRTDRQMGSVWRWVTVMHLTPAQWKETRGRSAVRIQAGRLLTPPLSALPPCSPCQVRYCGGIVEPLCE